LIKLITVSSPPQTQNEFVHEMEEKDETCGIAIIENQPDSQIQPTCYDPADLSSWPSSSYASPEQVSLIYIIS
jgi:hypothetical protein